jgi:hypothetical protein
MAWLTPASGAGCAAGNEMLEAFGRGSFAFGRRYDVWLHFAGVDGNVFEAGRADGSVHAYLASNIPQLAGRFALPRPYTEDGKRYSAFLLGATFEHEICPGRRITAMCSLVFLKSDESATGASHAKVACQLTVV